MKTRALVVGLMGVCLLCSGLIGCFSFFQSTPIDPLALQVKQEQADVKRLQTSADSLAANRRRVWEDIQTLKVLQTLTPDQIAALPGMEGKENLMTSASASDTSRQSSSAMQAEKKGIVGSITGSITGFFGKIGNGLKKLWPF
ncbi:MAG: hypothetical protein HY710_12265 [Candidatus Latescibacteria bacterium]|nr:hypothetical protein [Candidatus Latescibacterota bacterium]